MGDEALHDRSVVATLDRLMEPARECFAFAEKLRRGEVPSEKRPAIEELKRLVVAALEAHPRFKLPSELFFEGKQLILDPQYQALNLLKVAAERGSEKALAWLDKIYSTRTTGVRFVAAVYGLVTAQRHRLSNGVCVVPLKELPDSPHARGLQAQFQVFHLPAVIRHPPIGTILEVHGVCGSAKPGPPRSNELERTVKAFTLADHGAPVVDVAWSEFTDHDLAGAEFGHSWMNPTFEDAPGPMSPIEVNQNALSWVEKYLKLTPDVRNICDVAIDRLNMARRRHSPGNKAIEGAICLESLLGDDDSNELTYKLKLRAALLLETDLEKRREIRKAVGQFYTLRSKTVHGRGQEGSDAEARVACAANGLEICSRVLRAVVERNEKPAPADWELAGGVR